MEKTIKYLENGEYHYATVRSVGDLAQLKTDSKETLVEAINELWNGGGNADPSKAPKPEGYDQLVEDVADAVKNQQEISQQWIEWQKEDAQLTEERKQAYLQAMKEMQESIDKAKADAAALDDKTAKLDEQITKTFSDLDTSIQNMHEQLQKEADRMNQDLINTKSDLTKVRTDLQNAQMDNGKIHDELTNINRKFEHKVWQTDLDPLKEQIDRAETSVQQTKDELLGKASRQDLDTVTNTVSKLDTQLKETAKGVEISVKKDELGGEIAEALTNKTNILLGTRRFTTNNWTQRDHVEICSDPWKGFLVAKQNSPIEGIQQAYDVKAGTAYTFSLFAKMDNLDDSNKPQITLAQNNLDTSLDTKIDVWRKDIDDITSDFKRYDLTFTPSEDYTIYPHVISNSNNPIFVCGYQLEIGKELTPWEPNQEDVGDYVEKSEAQFNVYNDKIQALTEKQRQQGDTQEQLRTEVTQTAEGVKQVSESLKNTNGDITKLRGDLERTADDMKSEYETYTNKAVGQISDSTLNLIRNSSFQNKDEDFAQWQNVSTKANVRQDENGLCWVELTQSGLTTDNPQGLTSNYFNVKQGKVTVAVDIKSGDKATLDNESVLFLELYNDAKKRVDFRFVTLSELGLSKNLLDDHKVHRGLYRLGIDRNDAQYMTVKAHLIRNGDLYFTNFSARLSSIDDGAYEPNPDDINQQILKQNTKIEQNAKEVAIKANSVDVTRDIKSAVDNVQIGGVNLVENGDANANDAFPWPHTQFQNHTFYHSGTKKMFNLHTASKNELVADNVKWFPIEAGQQYTLSFKGFMSWNAVSYDVWLLGKKIGVDERWTNSFPIISGQRLSNGHCETITKTFTAPSDWNNFEAYLRFDNNGSSDGNDSVFFFNEVKLEKGNKATSYSPAPGDTSKEIKSAKDAAIQVASDQINIHVNELTTSFDDKLNKRVNEVKTASEKFTSDGIEQTVTKITNVKNDVDRLGDKVNGIQVGGRNLLISTSENEISGKAYSFANYQISGGLQPNKTYTLSGWARVDQDALNHKQWVMVYVYADDWSWSVNLNIDASATSKYNKLTFTTPVGKQLHPYVTVYLSHPDGGTNENNNDAISGKAYIKKLKLEEGNFATDYTHAPEDIDKKIDTQTLDSANIDNLKTQGHYFVRNLTGNPIGGWVYVDVTGNNNDRIRQDVYQDNGGKHMYRRWFGNYWTGWDGAASQNDLNSVKTEVTASVKNLGDRVTTQVNSVETKVTNVNDKVDNLSIGGRNLLKGTRDFNSKYWYQSGDSTFLEDNPVDSSVKEIHSYGDWASFRYKQTIQLDPNKNYMISADIAIYDGDGNGLYVTPYGTVDGQESNLAGTDVNLAGFPRQVKGEGFRRIYLPMTQHGRTLKDFRIEGHGNWSAGKGSVFISKIALYEGNTKMAWSDSSDDFVEAIKEVNTKWDVANGQIQGKVTETDVNNILNGKGYATQSWAQSNFRMKSDSISLEVKEITDPISNRVNNVNSKLDNLQVGGTNLLKNSVGPFQPHTDHPIDNYNEYPDSVVELVNGEQYTISGTTNGVFSQEHNTSQESDKCVLWLVDDAGINQIVSDENTAKGTTFIWNHPTKKYVLRVNTYHPGSTNQIKAWKIKIEKGNKATDWSPAPEDTSAEIKSAKDDAINVASGKIDNSHKELQGQIDNSSKELQGKISSAKDSAENRAKELESRLNTTKNELQDIKAITQWHTVSGPIDLNDLKTQTRIFYRDIQDKNSAVTGWQYIVVDSSSDKVTQTVWKDNSTIQYIRQFTGAWSNWVRQTNQNDIDEAKTGLREEIKSAKDAAINVTKDNIEIKVNELKTTYEETLNTKINEVKTASEKFTSDGIEQVVTKVTEVKGDVDGVRSKVDNLQIGGRNLLIGTSEDEKSGKAYIFADYQISGGLQPNKTYTLSGWARVDQNSLNHHQHVFVDAYSEDWSWSVSLNINASLAAQYNKLTFTTPNGKQLHPHVTVYLSHPDGGTNENNNDAISGMAFIKKLKLEEGNIATDYSPAPEDINKKIDLQTLDNANIDDLKTAGHYFVHNLNGNPITGWVYVDVVGNGADRIRQDVYQDSNGQHMYRRWFGNYWTGWDGAASQNDLNSVKTEVTASVKNLGDRVTTEVNSVTSKVDNMKIGGRNLLKGTRDFNSKYWYQSGDHTELEDNPIDTSTKEIHSWLDWHSFKNNQTIQLEPSKNYMISADIAIYNGDGNGLYVAPYGTVDGQGSNLAGTDVNLAGFPRQVKGEGFRRIYLPVTAHGRTLKDFRIEGHGNWSAGKGSVFISKIALYEGNTPLAWSDSSDDFVEAIKEVNTKWDVANGQIQGKVTETDVNNILNGKGYATQSWAQTMFQMKSDSITLQAVRDNITNGIQNQVNNIDNRVTNAQIGERNLAVGTNRGKAGWWVNPGNGTASTDIALLNGVKGLHINNTKKSTSWWVVCYPFDMGKLKPNTYYTISFDIQTSENTNGGAIIDLARGDSSGSPFIEGRGGNITTKGGEITHVTRTLKTGGGIENNGQALYINSIALGGSNVVNIANLMIVEGTQSPVWKPAPEDQGSGQNLLRGTADFSWPAGIGFNGDFNTSFERFDDTSVAFHLWGSKGGGIYTQWGGAFPDGQLQVGEQYTFSFDIKGSGKFSTVHNESEPEKPPITLNGVNVPSEWARVSVTGTIQALDKAFIIYFRDNFDVRIKNVKIERGAIATPWTPHPFDDKDKGVNLLKSTAYWNPNDWNHLSDGKWYDDNWTDNLGHKAYGRSNSAWDGLGQTVYVTPGVYTWSAQIYLNGLDSNDSVYPYMGDGQYNGTVQVQDIRKPMLGVNDQNKWINYSTTFYVKNAGNLCVRPELNRDHGNIHVGSQKLEHGMVATPWTPSPYDSDPKNIVSAINITPDQIKIASNKIVIDGNTDIQGDLRTDRVRLVGKQGLIDMTGDQGIQLKNSDGSSILLGNGNMDLMYKSDFRMNIDSSMITIMHRNPNMNQSSPIAIGNIGAMFRGGNGRRRGLGIRYNPGSDNEQLHGADFLDIGYNDPNKLGNIINQLELTSKDMQLGETRKRKGINFLDDINLQSYQKINVGDNDQEEDGKWSNDPLMIHRVNWSNSYQADRYQPTIRLGYGPNSYGHAGITFLWDQIKPFGDRDISDLGSIWFNGQRFSFGWVHHQRMFNNQDQPAFMRFDDKGGIMSGVAFASGSTWDLGTGAWNITASVMNHGG